ncbi:hypothetical protein POVWA2_046630 [Plasmodium ovale wallikeri]|uniref:Uncharacterized protein n=2 Tax=Plasmodium ovale TaxID=36330 RepID=A0A1A8ZHH9_PLAOA|nr:hypothetical protein POVWA1_047700 [Plasmodium ovale wallikeri]SBT43834.1 hypothetical protein POVWA2_046630 [Plasmodium ovale wallikeri]SBT78488.1 conserved Plasmodium protein, unknown function [Plasmodium ovale]
MSENNSEPIGLKTKIDELEKILHGASLQRGGNHTEEKKTSNSSNFKMFQEKRDILTDLLTQEKKKTYDIIEDFKNNTLKRINILNEKNEDLRKQSDILMEERNKHLCCIRNMEAKVEGIKKLLM